MNDNNKYEVGVTSDDNNDTRLPGSVQPAPTMSPSSNFAQPGMLDAADTGGVIGLPKVGGDYVPAPYKTASVTGPTGEVETTYNHENLSAKYKYPNVHQDVPELGKPSTTYSDHT